MSVERPLHDSQPLPRTYRAMMDQRETEKELEGEGRTEEGGIMIDQRHTEREGTIQR